MADQKTLNPGELRDLQKVMKDTVREDGTLSLGAHETKLFLSWLDSVCELVEIQSDIVDKFKTGRRLWIHKNTRHKYLWVVNDAPIKGGTPVVEVGPPHE